MDTTVTHIGEMVIAALRAADYMESTIAQYEKTIVLLAKYVDQRGGAYTPALGATFASMTVSPRTGKFSTQRKFAYGRLVRLFDSYLHTGAVDLSTQNRGGGGPIPGGEEFIRLVSSWETEMDARGLAQSTRGYYGRVARTYLVFLEHRGISQLTDAGPGTVFEFFTSLRESGWAATSMFWVVANFRPFLKFAGRIDLVDATRMAGIRRPHRIIPTLSDNDIALVVAVCRSGNVSARDAAITLLALVAGLRACDIIALTLADIDWHARVVSTVQQKTGGALTLPIPELLMDRLVEYVLEERSGTDDKHVFLRALAPHVALKDHASIYRITAKTFHTAGATETHAGTHLLRQNAATKLLAAGIALPTISAVLGHASSDSTNHYLSVDKAKLLECVLPVPAGARS